MLVNSFFTHVLLFDRFFYANIVYKVLIMINNKLRSSHSGELMLLLSMTRVPHGQCKKSCNFKLNQIQKHYEGIRTSGC